jgi:hypothetical protein
VQRSAHAYPWHAQSSQAHDGPQQHEAVSFSVVVFEAQVQISSAIFLSFMGRTIRPSPPKTHDPSVSYTVPFTPELRQQVSPLVRACALHPHRAPRA